MITTCSKCHQEYDDTYYSTQCPHDEFQMHCFVFVDGKGGCAHTVEELTAATSQKIVPNPDCSYQQTLKNLSDVIDEEQRLKGLSNEDLVRECIKIPETNCLVIDEMCSRLFPGWADEKEENLEVHSTES